MAPIGPGERAVLLPWFWPDADSFSALLDSPGSLSWSAVRADPGLLFFLLTRNIPFSAARSITIEPADLHAAAVLLADAGTPWVSWKHPSIRLVTRTAAAAAHYAELLARRTASVEPARAWAGAWIAYGGWMAIGVTDPGAVANCLSDPALATDPFGSQIRAWGLRRADIALRLAAEWSMPRWARALLGRLDASPADIPSFGGDRRLQAIVQTSILLAEQTESRLFMTEEFDLEAALVEIHVNSADLDRVRDQYGNSAELDLWINRQWADPRTMVGITERLRHAAQAQAHRPRPSRAPQVAAVDSVGMVQPVPYDRDSDPVREAKLAAVAEFAAGASHEINNPLAVISGQSEYLLRAEGDSARRKSLESIVRQTRRIHSILTELMYFARPPVPHPERVELGQLVRDVVSGLAAQALERQVDVQVALRGGPLWIDADPKQLAIALTALVRNGVEAAPDGGWVRVTSTFRPERLDVVVEDNGPGPDTRSLAHLFDPFYSGRAAGRGRGLGLPAAWRLAREHGGDVRFVPAPGGPTRFVLTLPAATVASGSQRKTA